MGDTKKERRTQAERTATTRAALLDAAVECLAEVGYAKVTTTEVARRAGVSRGAQLHHFPSKAELLRAATARLCERRLEEFRKAFAAAEPGADRIDTAIDVMWSMYDGITFVSYLELQLAARTDATLRQAMIDDRQRFFDGAAEAFAEALGDTMATDEADRRRALAFAFALMDGMALNRLGGPTPVPSDDVLDALKVVAHLVTPPTSEEPR